MSRYRPDRRKIFGQDRATWLNATVPTNLVDKSNIKS
jgi:hypothetical protein